MKKTWLLAALFAATLGGVCRADEVEGIATPLSTPVATNVETTPKPSSSRKPRKAAPTKTPTPSADPAPAETSTASAPQDYAPAQNLLFSALGLIGVKYKWGGNDPSQGLDCSGFVKYVFQNSMKIALPRTAFEMSRVGADIEKDELQPGDLVFFNTLKRKFSHVGIYLGDNRFIHAPRKGRRIEVVNINDKYWSTRFNGGRRMAEGGGEAVDVASLLAQAGRKQQEVNEMIRNEPPSASGSRSSCRKVTTGTGAKRKTVTVCSKPKTAKSATKTTKTTKTKTPAKTAKPAPKAAAKKPVKKP